MFGSHSIPLPDGLTPPVLFGTLGLAGMLLFGSLMFSARPRPRARHTFDPALDVYETACRVFDETSSEELQAVARPGKERRDSVRRAGNPIPVRVNAVPVAAASSGSPAVVLDRSTGGLCIAVDRALSPGQLVHVRAEAAPDSSPWVRVEVRSCRKDGRFYQIGCRFTDRVPWGVLLLFG